MLQQAKTSRDHHLTLDFPPASTLDEVSLFEDNRFDSLEQQYSRHEAWSGFLIEGSKGGPWKVSLSFGSYPFAKSQRIVHLQGDMTRNGFGNPGNIKPKYLGDEGKWASCMKKSRKFIQSTGRAIKVHTWRYEGSNNPQRATSSIDFPQGRGNRGCGGMHEHRSSPIAGISGLRLDD